MIKPKKSNLIIGLVLLIPAALVLAASIADIIKGKFDLVDHLVSYFIVSILALIGVLFISVYRIARSKKIDDDKKYKKFRILYIVLGGLILLCSIIPAAIGFSDSGKTSVKSYHKIERSRLTGNWIGYDVFYLADEMTSIPLTLFGVAFGIAGIVLINRGRHLTMDEALESIEYTPKAKFKTKETRKVSEEAAKKRKKIAKIAAIVTPIVAVGIAFVIVLITVIIPTVKKNKFITKYGQEVYDKYGLVEEGEYITFGSYEQDNNTANGKEKIEWLVLEVEDNKALIISKYALDYQGYYTGQTWETDPLREWLNSSFIDAAFSSEDQNCIISSTVKADENPSASTWPGNDTTDKAFLLSVTEVNEYFGSNGARRCQGTAYCYAQGAVNEDNGNCNWWLRSPGDDHCSAAYVFYNGEVNESGSFETHAHGIAVRPAMWISLES